MRVNVQRQRRLLVARPNRHPVHTPGVNRPTWRLGVHLVIVNGDIDREVAEFGCLSAPPTRLARILKERYSLFSLV